MTFRLAATVPFLLAGCAPLPDLPQSAAFIGPADTRATGTAPTEPVLSYQPRRVEAPADWRRLNDRQAPGGGS
ncbi:hypothetical protein [Palleronia pelagia]|uniref:Uncharacterized protein n=1 Tax=Palleronia pelagia TaxID=387096 RepID=A0A1H8BCE7_9RHOB|nr:hypothetical protein [Palleronia pelagia]SEM80426.1 hypothetical protein SAMN04488011_101537 [Palleronia pelagia]